MSGPTRERLLEAAVRLLAEGGVQAVTHRSVEDAAGVARGSTRYHFGTRDDLLGGVLAHLAGQGEALIERAAASVAGASVEPGVMDAPTQADAMRAMAAAFLADPAQDLARFELFLYACRRPELADDLARWRGGFIRFAAEHLRAQGAAHPEAAARLCVASLDGLVLHALTVPHDDFRRFGPAWMAALADLAVGFGGTADTAQREPTNAP